MQINLWGTYIVPESTGAPITKNIDPALLVKLYFDLNCKVYRNIVIQKSDTKNI